MQREIPQSEHRPTTRNLRLLIALFGFVRPYSATVMLAVVALLMAAAAVLAFGQVIREVVDHGLGTRSGAALDGALVLVVVVVVLMAVSVAGRAYLVSCRPLSSTPFSWLVRSVR